MPFADRKAEEDGEAFGQRVLMEWPKRKAGGRKGNAGVRKKAGKLLLQLKVRQWVLN